MTAPTLPVTLPTLTVDVPGTPVAQGSKQIVGRGRAPYLIDANANALKPWRKAVTTAAQARMMNTGWATINGPCAVSIDLWFPRPASVRRELMCVKPDVDKAARAILDALTDAGVWSDDSRVTDLHVRKHYALASPGARITIRTLP